MSMTPEEIKERVRQHRAAQGVRKLEVEEWGLVGDDALFIRPVSVQVRAAFFDRFEKSKYMAMVWLASKMATDKDGKQLFSEVFLKNEADPTIIDRIFSFISEPFLGNAVDTDEEMENGE